MTAKYSLEPRTKDIYDRIERVGNDKLLQFVAEKLREDLLLMQAYNRSQLFAVCKKYKIPSLYVGMRELVGRHDVRHGTWPAMWRIKDELDGTATTGNSIGFSAGCGNRDQTQTHNNSIWFGSDFVGNAYVVRTEKQCKIEPFKKNMVCDRKRVYK